MEENKENGKLKRALGPLAMVAVLLVIIIAGLVVGSRFLERPVGYGTTLSKTSSPNQNAPSSLTPGEVPTISMAEVNEKLNKGADITIVDVRSADDYKKFHLPGAISIPYAELNQRSSDLSRQDEIVVYTCST
jgi:hypothetical protein